MATKNIDTKPLIKALLWAGIEDYCPLWQAVWEINTLIPDLPEQDRLDITRMLVRSLLDARAVNLVWLEGDAVEPIDMHDAQLLINEIQHWAVRASQESQVCLTTTAEGEKYYQTLA
ncbi:MAG: hypothetical protein R3E79_04160 [Caldilineaceae bacterium]